MKEIIVDNFAGGGGTSTGIELAIKRSVDIAINHDPDAIAMHKANHPNTKHFCENVWEVDPRKAAAGRPVALAWFSPDCKHFSKAKGGKPVEKSIRGLAWVAVKWAGQVHPRVIILENVQEFQKWGPLIAKRDKNGRVIKTDKSIAKPGERVPLQDQLLVPDPKKEGKTFKKFVKVLKSLGYEVEYRKLKACDYGAPTNRERFFLIARCDGKNIVWPKPTHGDPNSKEVKLGLLKPWIPSYTIIDWELTCKSIFNRKKPLAQNTMDRIYKGIDKFIINSPKPFILDESAVEKFNKVNHKNNKNILIAGFISQQYKSSIGHSLDNPLGTITTINKNILVMAFLIKYYGADVGQSLNEPLHTVTTKDRFGLVKVYGENYKIVDIEMRMLQPHELFAAQSFPKNYKIDRDYSGKKYPKTKQTARCGNAVPPVFAMHLTKANLPELCTDDLRQAV